MLQRHQHERTQQRAVATIGTLIRAGGLFADGDWIESKDQNPDGDVRLIQLADIGDGNFRDRSNRFLTSGSAANLHCTYLESGDVLIARMPDPLGRACLFLGVDRPAVTAVDVCIVRVSTDDIEPAWLVATINSPQFRRQIHLFESGTTRRRISRKNFARIELPVPPLGEQRRIAAELDRQFSILDVIDRTIDAGLARAEQLRQTILHDAFAGRPVSQDAADEPAPALLARIRAEQVTA